MMSRALIVMVVLLFASSALSIKLAPVREVAEKIEGEYIVVFTENISDADFNSAVESLRGLISAESSHLKTFRIGAFAAGHFQLTAADLAKVRVHNKIQYIEENGVVTTSEEPACREQKDVIWNLDRIEVRRPDLQDDLYRYGYAGEGVDSYIIDTGILITHDEFEGRATWGANFADNTDADCQGHGTHVAGSVGGRLFGVAKKTNLIAVKVLNCAGSGTNAGVISGVEWTATHASRSGRPSVANMSLGGGKSAALNDAVAAAIKTGVTFVVAAGNSNADACNYSPASEQSAITVAATTIVEEKGAQKDRRSSFSNYGTCVKVAAPGELIKAAWIGSDKAVNTISGTSMASPHVAGVVAILLSANNDLSPAQVEKALLSQATDDLIDLACNNNAACNKTPNVFLFTECSADAVLAVSN